jgi:GTP-binding protein Era
MMSYVESSFKDADILLFITDIYESEMNHKETLERVKKLNIPVLAIVNKMDLGSQDQVEKRILYWKEKLPNAEVIPISALHGFGKEWVWERILELLPEGPAYFEKEDLSDRPVRFFVSEMIREKIFLFTDKEVPYCTQVDVNTYEEEENIIRIRATIVVERDSQKGIIIGKAGDMLKKIGREARKDIENFVGKQVFLQTFVKVDKDWRESELKLKKYGY